MSNYLAPAMLKFLLFPLALLFDLVTRIRNYLYDTGRRRSVNFEIPVIAVGNLSVGGTGKTPHVEYLIRLLKGRYQLATLSRGYKRKTSGFVLADTSDSAGTIGDEPYQYFLKYGNEISVSVGEERALAIPFILMERPQTDLILMDDAFQHRTVKPGFSILLTDINRPFYDDYLLPVGLLREARKGAARADAVIVTKCKNELDEKVLWSVTAKVSRYAGEEVPVFFTGIRYGKPVSVFKNQDSPESFRRVLLFSGLANAAPLVTYVKEHFDLVQHLDFPDHYSYRKSDLEEIVSIFKSLVGSKDKGALMILTTEKDMVKLLDPVFKELLDTLPVFYLPIEVFFLRHGDIFDKMIDDYLLSGNTR